MLMLVKVRRGEMHTWIRRSEEEKTREAEREVSERGMIWIHEVREWDEKKVERLPAE